MEPMSTDESPARRGVKRPASAMDAPAAGATANTSMFAGDEFPELLRVYYQLLFPYQTFAQWLSYEHATRGARASEPSGSTLVGSYLARRELSFTLADDTYIRYKSFSSADEMRKELLALKPVKIDIGAVYNHPPKDHKALTASAFQPLEKELVFDVDMTDYDDVRTCCQGADICMRCWRFMQIAIKVVDRALREDFGFAHLLWVFSGRRGVHCWVCDPRARALPSEGRSAIVEYLSVFKKGGEAQRRVFLTTPLFPGLDAVAPLIHDQFAEVLVEQGVFGSAAQWAKFLPLVTNETVRGLIEETLVAQDGDNPEGVWEGIKQLYAGKQHRSRLADLDEMAFTYCYPRLDVNVTKGLNHLLKSPFCVHPKTGRVCVPIDPAAVDAFSPFSVPTVAQLVEEINAAPAGTEPAAMARFTSLQPYLDFMERFLAAMHDAPLASGTQPATQAATPGKRGVQSTAAASSPMEW